MVEKSSPRHPHGVNPDDPNLYSHSAPSTTDASRRERQGEGPCRGLTDDRFFSNFRPNPAHATNAGQPVVRDAEGMPAFGENLSAESHREVDRIRRRER